MEDAMRVAYIVNQYPKVSHSFIRREILALERRGYEVTRIAFRGWDGDLADDEDALERTRTRYVLREGPLPLIFSFFQTLIARPVRLVKAIALAWRMAQHSDRPLVIHLIYLAEACRILGWVKNARIQHLHAHFGTNSAEVAMLVHVLGGPDWSFTVHGPEEFDKAELIHLAEKIHRSAFVVAISSYGRSQLYRLVHHSLWPKVEVVHCGLEPAYFDVRGGSISSLPRLVCVGRLAEQKGQMLLLEAARRLAARGTAFNLVLAGDGDMRADINDFIAKHNLAALVRVTGWISGQQVRDEILAARALVLPSFAEGLPVVIMEAMALRRPVISTFVAGIPELVKPGQHGWLVAAGDVDALVEAMQNCIDMPAVCLAAMGHAAQVRSLTRHNIDAEAAHLAKLLESGRKCNL